MATNPWANLTPEQTAARKAAIREGAQRAKRQRDEAKRIAAEQAAATPVPEAAITVKQIAVPGVVLDAQGNHWTLPSDSLDDDRIFHKSLFHVPNPDPRFYYQFERESDAATMMNNPDFPMVPVTLAEQGLDKFHASTEYGLQKDKFYRINDSVCMKIPVEFERRRRKLEKRMVDASVGEVQKSSKVKADTADHKSDVEFGHYKSRVQVVKANPAEQGAE